MKFVADESGIRIGPKPVWATQEKTESLHNRDLKLFQLEQHAVDSFSRADEGSR